MRNRNTGILKPKPNPAHEEIYDRITAACDRFKGIADIKGKYTIIDNSKYKVVAR